MSPFDLMGLQQLKGDDLAMRAAREPPSSNEGKLIERANMCGLVRNAIEARLWYTLARTKLLRHRRPPLSQSDSP